MTIWIDIHPARENPTNTPRTLPMPVHVRFLWVIPIRDNLSRVIDRVEQAHCSWEEGFPTQSIARRWLIHGPVPSFSPEPANEVVGAKPSIYRRPATSLISPVCDLYVQYLLAGANPSVLNRHRRMLQPWRCQLSMYHSANFPISYLPFPPKCPTRSPV
jgi:hypothetical protein